MKKTVLAILMTLTLMLGGGCAVIESAKESPATAYITVQYATAKIVRGDTDRASATINKVTVARSFINRSAEVTVSNLVSEVRENINWGDIAVEDRMLIEIILAQAEQDLQVRIGEGFLDADQRVTIVTLLDWIEEAARTTLRQNAES